MLETNMRYLYLDALRPPEGYELDRGIATTYSLDLPALLVAPLSLALIECEDKDKALKDPVALLESLRRCAGKLTIFCQKGGIHIPSMKSLLYSYLENMIVEVNAPHPKGVFHPKIWLLRFTSDHGPVIYRFLCLSRNITLSRSWDLIISVEGELTSRKNAFARNNPIGDFIAALPGLAAKGMNRREINDIKQMADEVRRVRLKAAPPFNEDISFHPLGIPGYKRFRMLDRCDRMLVISPFLSNGELKKLSDASGESILISTVESVDALSAGTRDKFNEIYTLDQAVEEEERDLEERSEGGESGAVGEEKSPETMHGLHAKIFSWKRGWNASIFTGSANATASAFHRNVEFMVKLTGSNSQIGPEALLGKDNDLNPLRHLLCSYSPPEKDKPIDQAKKDLEDRLEIVKRELSRAPIELKVQSAESDEGYNLKLIGKSLAKNLWTGDLMGNCHPITMTSGAGDNLKELFSAGRIVFPAISEAALTSFVAFEIKGERDGSSASTGFVLNLPITGLPETRMNSVLRRIISSKSQFLRYLMMLLYNEESLTPRMIAGIDGGCNDTHGSGGDQNDLPLLEDLVRTYSRQPDRLERINRLVEELASTPEGKEILPEGFADLWNTFKSAGVGEKDNE